MSGLAEGLILLALIAGGLPLVGLALVGSAVAAGVRAAANAASSYERDKRNRREEIRRSGINESIGSFRSSVASNMNEQTRLNTIASEQMMQELEKSRNTVAAIAESNDPEQYQMYIRQIRQSRQELSNNLFEIQDSFVKNYHTKINESMDNVSRTINSQYASYLNELQQFQSNLEAKKERARQLSNEYIEEAKAILISLEQDFEGAKFANLQLIELQSQLNEAIGQYNKENYEAALATAKDVSLSGIEEIYKCDCKKQEWDNYYKLALTISSELIAYMEAQSVITAEVKDEVEKRIEKPLEEDIVGINVSDYTDEMKNGQNQFDYLLEKTKEIKAFLDSEEAEKMSIQQLKAQVDTLNNKLYPAASLAIYKGILNMSNAFSRQNISEEIIDFFEDHNFSFKGYSYDNDQHDEALYIGLENEATGEEIIVTLAPELMENGEVQTRVDIDQLMGDEANEERKAFYRQSIENVVVENTPGAQIKIECKKEFKNKLSNNTELREKIKS